MVPIRKHDDSGFWYNNSIERAAFQDARGIENMTNHHQRRTATHGDQPLEEGMSILESFILRSTHGRKPPMRLLDHHNIG